MLKENRFIYAILIIEGASLMTVELLSARLLAPTFGTSLYVWTAVLAITILGLSLGYYSGARLSKRKTSLRQLMLILTLAALFVFAMPYSSKAAMFALSSVSLVPGILIACFFLIIPPTLLFGMVGPLATNLLARTMDSLGNIAGSVYFTSTSGGIIATFLTGFYLIPEKGLQATSLAIATALLLPPLFCFFKALTARKIEKTLPEKNSGRHLQNEVMPAVKHSVRNSSSPVKRSVYLLALLEGASVMAIELITARMLAPYYGSSLFVWGAVIGTTMLSLAIGYYSGGRLADRFPGLTTIYWIFLASAVFTLLMHYNVQGIALSLSRFDLRFSTVIVSILLVMPPLLFLGMIPTLLIRYLTTRIDEAGTATGMVFAISSVSGILSLLLMGFVFIPRFGLVLPSLITGLLLGIVPVIALCIHKKYHALLFVVVFAWSYSQQKKLAVSPDVDVKYFSEGLLGQVMVADLFRDETGQPLNERVLFINRRGHTIISKPDNVSRWDYVHYAEVIASRYPKNSKALMLGLGGGTLASALVEHLGFTVDAVELDSRIANVASEFFSLHPSVRVIVDDARHFIETTNNKYDFIFFDVFTSDAQPPHVLSRECFEKTGTLLQPNGMIAINFFGFIDGDAGFAARSVYKTLTAAGFYVKILPTPGTEAYRNILFIASAKPQVIEELNSIKVTSDTIQDENSGFIHLNQRNLHDANVYTDDKSNLESAVLEAGYAWRKGYNEYYTKFFTKSGIPLFR